MNLELTSRTLGRRVCGIGGGGGGAGLSESVSCMVSVAARGFTGAAAMKELEPPQISEEGNGGESESEVKIWSDREGDVAVGVMFG